MLLQIEVKQKMLGRSVTFGPKSVEKRFQQQNFFELTTPSLEGVRKKFQITNFTIPNNTSSMKYALLSVPGLADVGAPLGWL